ncbi:uncharacterized protein LOC110006756 [Amborella trichopoda]|uniref:uncharacterized protein LOC110006756 n=1 Tax=Amborella trichopoda TaxID=13333 RepID=UPI0009C185B8|nr:uncharacterized protein LOC110006756 [Amborella trichopoda]|eukprot:XP_020519440.1 uncharacterized protein LOC110006756 [Amborella trichopoda]
MSGSWVFAFKVNQNPCESSDEELQEALEELNSQADALSKLGATIQLPLSGPTPVWVIEWRHVDLRAEVDTDNERGVFPKCPPYPFGALLVAKDAIKAKQELSRGKESKAEKKEAEFFNPMCMEIEQGEDWREPIMDFIKHGRVPQDWAEHNGIRQMSIKYALLDGDVLTRLSFYGILLRCLDAQEASKVL